MALPPVGRLTIPTPSSRQAFTSTSRPRGWPKPSDTVGGSHAKNRSVGGEESARRPTDSASSIAMFVAPSVGSVTSRRHVGPRGLSVTPLASHGTRAAASPGLRSQVLGLQACALGDPGQHPARTRRARDFREPPAVVLSFDLDFKGDQGLTATESDTTGAPASRSRRILSANRRRSAVGRRASRALDLPKRVSHVPGLFCYLSP